MRATSESMVLILMTEKAILMRSNNCSDEMVYLYTSEYQWALSFLIILLIHKHPSVFSITPVN